MINKHIIYYLGTVNFNRSDNVAYFFRLFIYLINNVSAETLTNGWMQTSNKNGKSGLSLELGANILLLSTPEGTVLT